MRIFAVSDLHTDFAENRRRLQRVSSTSYLRDVLVVAGDIADDLRAIDWTLRTLRSRFGQAFYVPGNHELWVRDGKYDSVEKFRRVLRTWTSPLFFSVTAWERCCALNWRPGAR
jgi:3',5'-cyclic AMP phosphodiesterase CpdA